MGPISALFNKINLFSHAVGKAISLKDVRDPVFSEGLIGVGLAIIPNEGKIYSPADGVVEDVAKTNHAVSILTKQGVMLLIHVGIDTVNLKGEFLHPLVTVGDKVKKGQIILEFEVNNIKSKGYDIVTPLVVLNYEKFGILSIRNGDVDTQNIVLRLEKRYGI